MTTDFDDRQGAARLADWGVIRAHGADAAVFLHGQLTSGVTSLDGSRARLAGYCSAKGRLLASFVVWQDGATAVGAGRHAASPLSPVAGENGKAGGDPAVPEEPRDLLLACHASVLAATLKRLSMFVLRAKCRLTDATPDRPLWGVAGEAAVAAVGGLVVWGQREHAGASWIRLPDADGLPRALCVGAAAQPSGPVAALPALDLAVWRRLEVAAGVPTIEAATADQFVPQMLNFELLGGVDFQKGCYPGQEVVARSQYRGTIKRRMFRFSCPAPAAAGQEIFHSGDALQPSGRVCNAAPRPIGSAAPGCELLAEVKLAALDGGSLHLGSIDGPVLSRASLPYEVPAAERAAP